MATRLRTWAVEPRQTAPSEVVTERRWRELEKANVLRALEKAQFRLYGRGGAADLLGLNAATLAPRLKRLGIHPRDRKGIRKLE